MQFEAYNPANNPLNTNEWAFPVAEVIHIVGFAVLIGTITIVNLRLMGLGMKKQSASEILKATAPWTLVGLVMALFSGAAIMSSDPQMYMRNKAFHFKITALLIAIIYNWTIRRKVAMSPNPGGAGPLVGLISMLLWASIVFGGIFIAFI